MNQAFSLIIFKWIRCRWIRCRWMRHRWIWVSWLSLIRCRWIRQLPVSDAEKSDADDLGNYVNQTQMNPQLCELDADESDS